MHDSFLKDCPQLKRLLVWLHLDGTVRLNYQKTEQLKVVLEYPLLCISDQFALEDQFTTPPRKTFTEQSSVRTWNASLEKDLLPTVNWCLQRSSSSSPSCILNMTTTWGNGMTNKFKGCFSFLGYFANKIAGKQWRKLQPFSCSWKQKSLLQWRKQGPR